MSHGVARTHCALLVLLFTTAPVWMQTNSRQPHGFLQKYFNLSKEDLAAIEAGKLVANWNATFSIIARPSGTEPKIKFYVELVAAVKTPAEVAAARGALDARCHEIEAAVNRRLGFA